MLNLKQIFYVDNTKEYHYALSQLGYCIADLFHSPSVISVYATNHTRNKFIPTRECTMGIVDNAYGSAAFALKVSIAKILGRGVHPGWTYHKDGTREEHPGMISFLVRNPYPITILKGSEGIISKNYRGPQYIKMRVYYYDEVSRKIIEFENLIPIDVNVLKVSGSDNFIYFTIKNYGMIGAGKIDPKILHDDQALITRFEQVKPIIRQVESVLYRQMGDHIKQEKLKAELMYQKEESDKIKATLILEQKEIEIAKQEIIDYQKYLKIYGGGVSKEDRDKEPSLETGIAWFCDVSGFTQMGERLKLKHGEAGPVKYVGMLNDFLASSSEVIQLYKGVVNKFKADEIFTLYAPSFNKTTIFKKHEDNMLSFLMNRDFFKNLERLNTKYSDILSEINCSLEARTGINTGEIIVANIGSKNVAMDFTGIHDNINTASRLESTGVKGVTHLSPSVYQTLNEAYVEPEMDYLQERLRSDNLFFPILSKKKIKFSKFMTDAYSNYLNTYQDTNGQSVFKNKITVHWEDIVVARPEHVEMKGKEEKMQTYLAYLNPETMLKDLINLKQQKLTFDDKKYEKYKHSPLAQKILKALK